MLVLTRRYGEKFFIGDDICITIVDVDRGKVRVGIEAPQDVEIMREELLSSKQKESQSCEPKR